MNLKEIVERLKEIDIECRKENVTAEIVEKLQKETDNLIAERNKIQSNIENVRSKFDELKNIEIPNGKNKEEERNSISEIEKRAKYLIENNKAVISNAAETRSILLATGGIAKPTEVNGINDMFPMTISIVDQVMVKDMTGVGENRVVYQKTLQTSDEKADGSAAAESNPTFGVVSIKPFLLGTLSYVSKELRKQTPLMYYEKVKEGALKSLKIKLADWIVNGGGSGKMQGILTTVDEDSNKMYSEYAVNAITIDDKFLRKLVLNYGGDANAYGGVGTLYLNKKDLIAFGDVRGTNEKKYIYEITPNNDNPNIGTITDGGLTVNYCIVPTLKALVAQTVPGDTAKIQTMFYGISPNYELDLFGNYEIEESRDYKFAEGLITITGEVMVGGAITTQNGFSVVTLQKA